MSREASPLRMIFIFSDPDMTSSWPKGGLFERINDRIKAQIEKVEDLTGDMDPKTNFALIVIQTELERYKFLIRSYLRARIAKVGYRLYLSRRAPRRRLTNCH